MMHLSCADGFGKDSRGVWEAVTFELLWGMGLSEVMQQVCLKTGINIVFLIGAAGVAYR